MNDYKDLNADIDNDRSLSSTNFGSNLSSVKNLNILYGVLLGFIADGEIQEEEKEFLKKWQNEHMEERSVKGLRPIIDAVDDALSDNVLTFEEVLNLINIVESSGDFKNNYLTETIDTQLVLGVCNGVIADGKITNEEIRLLLHSIRNHTQADVSSEWSTCLAKIESLLDQNQSFSPDLLDELRHHINDFVTCPSVDNLPVVFTNNQFVLSGQFAMGQKKDVGKLIEDRGGIVSSSVSSKTRYVVVGGTRSVLWKYDTYGTKVAKAKNLKESGVLIDIISEGNLAATLE